MPLSLRSRLSLLALAAVATGGACGGNVIVDGSGGKTTVSSSSSSSSTTTGSTSSSSSSSTSTGSVTSSTTSSSSSSSSTTSSSSGACTDPSDLSILANQVIWPAEVNCAMQTAGNPMAAQTCVMAATGLSSSCGACLAQDLQCAEAQCLNICLSGPNSPACYSCRLANCGPAFLACSGLSRETGATSCAPLYGNGPESTPWKEGLLAAYFTTDTAYAAYQKYDTCACSSCPECQMDYCGGTLIANNNCNNCIQANCSTQIIPFCQAN